MDDELTPLERLAGEQVRLLAAIEAHALKTNELLRAMLNREQRQGFDAASQAAKTGPLPKP
jgi:hypothetical protein